MAVSFLVVCVFLSDVCSKVEDEKHAAYDQKVLNSTGRSMCVYFCLKGGCSC